VTFAIARIRRADEPFEAAWNYCGTEFVDYDAYPDACEQPACQTFRREEDPRGDVDMRYQCLEHVAGPSCTCIRGYSGYRISVNGDEGMQSRPGLIPKKTG
jgi:hypothetical protein